MAGEGPTEGPDQFGFFTHELERLFSGEKDAEDDYFPLMGFNSDEDGKEKEDVNGSYESDGLRMFGRLFCDGLGGELSDYKKEKLKGLLKQSVAALTLEVDQMMEVVLSTCQLKYQLRSKDTSSSSQGSASRDNGKTRPSKKHKKSRSPKLCNPCGLGLRKGTLQLSPGKKDQIIGSLAEAGNKTEEVTDDLKFLLDNDIDQVEQTMKKYVDEISSSLCHMEMQLEGFLVRITSKCRNMTFFEKQHLWKMIKDLPPKNFDQVAEIIRHGKGLEQHEAKEILVDLEDTDNTVLWRLYYYAKAVEHAQKLSA